MNRTRDYYRKMRAKHIKRKKKITSHYPGSDTFPYYSDDGRYSKNKIHCSCPLCKEKAYYGKHMPTMQEKKHNDSLESLVDDFYEEADDNADL